MTEFLITLCFAIVFNLGVICVGLKLLELLKIDNYLLGAIVGIFSIFALFQIFAYPAQLFHLPVSYLLIIAGLILFAMISITILNFKKLLKLKKVIFIGILFSVVSVLLCLLNIDALYYNLDLSDASYYLKLVEYSSVSNFYVNSMNPESATQSLVGISYAFSGVHHLFGAFSNILNVDSHIFTLWFGTFTLHFTSVLSVCYLVNYFKKDSIVKILLASYLFIFLSNDMITYGFLPIYFQAAILIDAVLLSIILKYYKTLNIQYIFLYIILSIGLMSCRSTQFFQSVIIVFCICVYEILIRKNNNIHFFTLIASPCIVYANFYLLYDNQFLFVIILDFFLIFFNIIYKYCKFLFNNGILLKSCLLIVFLVINFSYFFIAPTSYGFSYFTNFLQLNINDLNFQNLYEFCKYLLKIGIIAFPIYLILKWKSLDMIYKFLCTMQIAIILFFFNPFASAFVSTYLTGSVYERVWDVYNNYVYVAMFLLYFKSRFKIIENILVVSILFSSAFIFFNSTMKLLSNIPAIKGMKVSNIITKLGDDSLEIASFFNGYEETVTVLYPKYIYNSLLLADNIRNSELMPSFGELRIEEIVWEDLDLNPEKMKLQAILYRPEYYMTNYFYQNNPDKIIDIAKILHESDVELLVLSRWEDEKNENSMFFDELEKVGFKIWENENFLIYKLYEREEKQ